MTAVNGGHPPADAVSGGSTAAAPADPAPSSPPDAFTDRRLRSATRIAYGAIAVMVVQIPMWLAALAWSYYLQGLFGEGPDAIGLRWVMAGVVAVSVVLAVLAARLLRTRIMGTTRFRSAMVWGGTVAAVAVLALTGPTFNTSVAIGTWWAFVSSLGTRRQTAVATVLLLAGPLVSLPFIGQPIPWAQLLILYVFYIAIAAILRLITEGMLRLLEIAEEAVAGREAQARLAVSEERLRFSRDMHDLLGHSLSGIAVKSELAKRLTDRDPVRARAEMAEIQETARRALREVRSAVSGYRHVDLDAELDGVRSVLAASGAACTAPPTASDVPDELRDLVAWLVREAATNVIRHTRADHCSIAFRRGGGVLTVEVANDGAGAGADAPRGNGLTGLAERVSASGGTLTTSRSGPDGFLLRAVLPVHRDPPAAEPAPGPAPVSRSDERQEADS